MNWAEERKYRRRKKEKKMIENKKQLHNCVETKFSKTRYMCIERAKEKKTIELNTTISNCTRILSSLV